MVLCTQQSSSPSYSSNMSRGSNRMNRAHLSRPHLCSLLIGLNMKLCCGDPPNNLRWYFSIRYHKAMSISLLSLSSMFHQGTKYEKHTIISAAAIGRRRSLWGRFPTALISRVRYAMSVVASSSQTLTHLCQPSCWARCLTSVRQAALHHPRGV